MPVAHLDLITLPERDGKFAIFDSKFGRGKYLKTTLNLSVLLGFIPIPEGFAFDPPEKRDGDLNCDRLPTLLVAVSIVTPSKIRVIGYNWIFIWIFNF